MLLQDHQFKLQMNEVNHIFEQAVVAEWAKYRVVTPETRVCITFRSDAVHLFFTLSSLIVFHFFSVLCCCLVRFMELKFVEV